MTERQSARMSKITNDCLTRSGTGCFIAVPIRQQWASKGKDGLSSQIWQRKVKCGHQQQQNRRTHKLTHRLSKDYKIDDGWHLDAEVSSVDVVSEE